eukprot:TRINITY_DN16401_c0_g1_i1.p1 TRINITY_DN16401_c0_g1~~TRINITY_DN16401_c0_g1_i1.p1  ORF type:complete len:449 (+),score=44.56 TRINITY_DN16401_c0_g1_i1:79-1425(+)
MCKKYMFFVLLLVPIATAARSRANILHEFTLDKHTELVKHTCMTKRGRSSPHGRAKRKFLGQLFGSSWKKQMCDSILGGMLWPDCLTSFDAGGLQSACVAGVPFNIGMLEMVKQGAAHEVQSRLSFFGTDKPFKAHTMSTWRQAVQHMHGSPFLPLHLDDGRHIALVSQRQLRSKMIIEAFAWQCRSLSRFSKAVRSNDTMAKKQLVKDALFIFGKNLHPITDTFSISHVRRKFRRRDYHLTNKIKEAYVNGKPVPPQAIAVLRNSKIKKFLSMDDVEWTQHGRFDKGDDTLDVEATAMINLAHLAVSKTLEVLDFMLFELMRATDADGHFVPQQTLARVAKPAMEKFRDFLCNDVLVLANVSAGAGGSFKTVGLNGDASDWIAEIPQDDDTKSLVDEKFHTLVQQIDSLREKGQLPYSKDRPFVYPEAHEPDMCEQPPPTCVDLLKR